MDRNGHLYAVLLEDRPDAAHLRSRHIAAHLEFLEATPAIRSAGPLFQGGAVAGGMWLVAAEGEEEVRRMVESDPFWPAGLRASVRILDWRRVLADGLPTGFRP